MREGGVWVAAANRASSREREGVCGVAKALDRGTNLRMAGAISTAEQRLREEHQVERGDDLYRHESSDAPAASSLRILIHRHALSADLGFRQRRIPTPPKHDTLVEAAELVGE